MQHSHHQQNNNDNGGNWLSSRTGIAILVALSVLGFLLYTAHGAHLLGWLPFLLILACPLMHIFIHGGHGGHNHSNKADDGKKNDRKERHH